MATLDNSSSSASAPQKPTRKSLTFLPDNDGRHPEEMYDVDNRVVGTGSFGSVKTGRNKTSKQVVALKYIDKGSCRDLNVLQNEIDINKAMDHPNIARMYETFEDNQFIYIAMELCTGGELLELVIEQGHCTEAHACILMSQIFRAVYYMHTHSIVHRDLKPENFLIRQRLTRRAKIDQNTQVKVIDFGLAKRFDMAASQAGAMDLRTQAGSPSYVAPEVIGGRYNEKCDVWSCGVILYILLCGSPPFIGETTQEILESVKAGKIAFGIMEFWGISNDVKTLIKTCCLKDVAKRMSAQQAVNSKCLSGAVVPSCTSCCAALLRSDKFPAVLEREAPYLNQNLISKFKKFDSANRFQKAARHIIAHHLDENVLRKLQDQFVSMDTDGDGELTLVELKEGCTGILEGKEIDELFNSVDADHNGSISYSEFLAATMDSKHFMRREVYWEAFRVFDLDQNGRITAKEFEQIMQNDGSDSNLPAGVGNAEEIAAMFKEADSDGDGEIDFAEFCAMMDK